MLLCIKRKENVNPPGPGLVIGPDRPAKGNGYARFERRLPVVDGSRWKWLWLSWGVK
jgi:hypothetical protein